MSLEAVWNRSNRRLKNYGVVSRKHGAKHFPTGIFFAPGHHSTIDAAIFDKSVDTKKFIDKDQEADGNIAKDCLGMVTGSGCAKVTRK